MNSSPQQLPNCHAWIEVFTRLGTDGVPSSPHLEQITVPDVRFRDPFNDIVGRPALRALLEHTRRQVKDVRFQVLDTATSGQCVYLKWEMTGRVRVLGPWQVRGMSELTFDEAGKLELHQDYWDAAEQFYFHLPIIGRLLRWIRSLASVS